MKRLNLIIVVIVLGALTITGNQANAQKTEGIVQPGTITVSIGAGLGRSAYSGIYSDVGYGTGIGVKAVAERGMWQLGPGVLSLGVEAGGSFSTAHYSGYGYHSNIFIVAARGAYHYSFVDKLDTYAGVSVGPGFRSYGYTDNKYTDVIVTPGIFIGASYFFSDNIGVNVEAGYDITEIQGGIIFKLK